MTSFARHSRAAIAMAATHPVLAAEKGSPSQTHVNSEGVTVRQGAEWVSAPSQPDIFFLDARTRPVVPAWKPGDLIREVPRRFEGDMQVVNMRPPGQSCAVRSGQSVELHAHSVLP